MTQQLLLELWAATSAPVKPGTLTMVRTGTKMRVSGTRPTSEEGEEGEQPTTDGGAAWRKAWQRKRGVRAGGSGSAKGQ